MILKHFDYLSPPVTFYYKNFLSHTSIISGIISIFTIIIIISVSGYFSLKIIKRENPNTFYFNLFVNDSGTFAFNTSSLFHFISLANKKSEVEDVGVDFTKFRIIGIETYFQIYIQDKNLTKIDHWIYGLCNESDTKEISYLINQNFFNVSACIRKYFNSTEQKYYDTEDPKFKWPKMEHGTYHQDNKFYAIVLEKCEEETINLTLGEGFHCKSEAEINETIDTYSAAHLFYIDYYIDVLNYNQPYTKFISRLENSFHLDYYTVNHLYFNPSKVKSHNGLIYDHIEEEASYTYDRNDFLYYPNNKKIYMIYSFWLNNRMHYYERIYKRLPDVLSDIGGIYQFITLIAIILNKFYNNYIILSDTENLIFSLIDSERSNYIKLKSSKSKKHHIDKTKNNKDNSIKKRINTDELKNKTEIMKNDEYPSKSSINCISKIENIPDKFDIKNDNINKKSENDKIKENKNDKNNDLFNNQINNFFRYVLYKITLEKKNDYHKTYNIFRTKIVSEEHIFKNHLNIYNLLRVTERKRSKRKYSYQINDLIKLI